MEWLVRPPLHLRSPASAAAFPSEFSQEHRPGLSGPTRPSELALEMNRLVPPTLPPSIRSAMRFLFTLIVAFCPVPCFGEGPARSERSLDGPWEFRPEQTDPKQKREEWKPVTVPSAMQSHEGMTWHGVGWYRRAVGPIEIPQGKRLWLHFGAAATHAEVYWNDVRLGEHLGGWTPFRFDITDLVRKAGPAAGHVLKVKLDEKVGHNTQGFLPIVQPHFGGLWQSVKLITVSDPPIDDILATAPPDADLPVWSPQSPLLKEVTLTNPGGDKVTLRTARRKVEIRGDQLLLNGEPLQVRGVLNWGYYPPRLEPNPEETRWRDDLKWIKKRGFNLVKCCLWIPPKRLLEIADEEGVLLWIEYPTWHPQLTAKFLPDLRREFEEFFAHVRNHPSVILHSLTCETGPSADVNVLKDLTASCKRMIPGAIVEDDSSWIEWNRVTDFYDDHPYGNNHTWVSTLGRLRSYKALGIKPLLLGEAIAADTWTRVRELATRVGSERPYWLPHHFEGNLHWLHRMEEAGWKIDEERLVADSIRYAYLMRKFQMEVFRREVPHGGYVVSVMRDFPLAAMGLLDYLDRDKWETVPGAWDWHGQNMVTLRTPSDCRSLESGQTLEATVQSAGAVPSQAQWVITLKEVSTNTILGTSNQPEFRFPLPKVEKPSRLSLVATLRVADKTIAKNEWPLWLVPSPKPMAKEILLAKRLDEGLLSRLEAGARVLLLPDGGPGSPPRQSHWFLRGGPVVLKHPLTQTIPQDLLVETQHFDLAGDVIPDVSYLAEVDPCLVLWDNHDIRRVKTHALVFSTRVGKGRLLVSALRHDGEANAVGKWLLGEFADHLASGPEPRTALSRETIAGIRDKLGERKVDLGAKKWKFQPDPKNEGLAQKWHEPGTKTDTWADIRIDSHWEGQGYPTLDGWAWYRLTVEVPPSFAGKEAFLRFTGVDDHYEVYVNGRKVGTGGDIATKTTAFEEIKSHPVGNGLKPGEAVTIAVRVYDWYGAGGLFRPVTLTTSPGNPGTGAFVR